MSLLMVVGACYLDTILTVPYYPREDEKLRATALSKRRGGNGPNTLELLANMITHYNMHQDVRLYLCSVLPSKQSPAVDLIKSSLGALVDLSTCIHREDCIEAASSYIIQSAESGSRTLVNYSDLPEMTLQEFEHVCEKVGERLTGNWYHFEGRTPDVTLACIRYLRRTFPGIIVSVEVEKPGRVGLEELAAEADVVFYSQTWAKSRGYGTREQCLHAQAEVAQRASLLFCTWGADGSAAWCRSTDEIAEAPAFRPGGKPTIPVDSTGAGDAFIAGILFALLLGSSPTDSTHTWTAQGMLSVPPVPLIDMLEFANEVAGRKVAQHGFSGIAETIDKSLG